jgi:two-component system, chemotaxis family, protein-glutamate methylesterase/glutaminase
VPDRVRLHRAGVPEVEDPESPLALTCPECGGALRKSGSGSAAQYRCHIGHIFGARELPPAQLDVLEKALGAAHRMLNERIEFAREMVEDSRSHGRPHGLRYWQRVRDEAEQQIDAIRQVMASDTGVIEDLPAETPESDDRRRR